jgi:uncharacterized protein (DUF1499 family)
MNPTSKPSALILWCSRLAWLCLILVPVSVAAVRFGIVPFSAGLGVFALACVVAALLVLLMLIALLLPRFRDQRGSSLRALLTALPPVLLFVTIMGSSGDYPPIHDITTDTEQPPEFIIGAAERGEGSNSIAIDPEVIATQREHYPEIATLQSPLGEEAAFTLAMAVSEDMGWRIYNSDPENGVIEAAYTSFWFGFVDDVIIRIRPDGDGSAVDMRSVSRVGVSDLGANAKRIKAFQAAFKS